MSSRPSDATSGGVPPLPPGLLDAVRAQVATQAAPTRGGMRRRRLALALGCAAVATAVFFAYGGLRNGGAPRPGVLMVATTLGAAAMTGLILLLAARAQAWSMSRRAGLLVAGLLLTPLALFSWKVGWSGAFEGGMVPWPGRIGIPCLQISLLTGAGPLAAWLWLRRRSEPNRPALVGGLLGASAGGCGWVVTDLWCPVGHVPHLLLGHVLPLLLFMGLGGALGARYLAIRWLAPRR